MSIPEFPPLDEAFADASPFPLFGRWFADAEAAQLPEFCAMTLATALPDGTPSARIVLLRGFDESGFGFYTHYQSRKAGELAANPQAALVLFWAPFHRQVRIEGPVGKVAAADSDAYFASRPRGHRLGAVASPQSQVIADRRPLEARMAELEVEFQGRDDIPRPESWGGYRVTPRRIEFWQGRDNRLHDRLRYTLQTDGAWKLERLAP